MEEVDQIILNSFDNIGCDFAKKHEQLTELTTEEIVEAAVNCLKIIDPDFKMSSKFPPGMSARFRVGTTIAQACQKIGYKGEIGYQTFLYHSESEIRKVFMFLVEKLPKGNEQEDDSAESSSLLQKRISQVLKKQSNLFWLPPYCMKKGKCYQFKTTHDAINKSFEADKISCVEEKVATKLMLVPSLFEDNAVGLCSDKCSDENQKSEDIKDTKLKRKEDYQWKDVSFSTGDNIDLNASYDDVIKSVCNDVVVAKQAKGSRFTNTRDLQFTVEEEETEKEKPPVPKKRTSVKQDAKEDDESKENEEKVENEEDSEELEAETEEVLKEQVENLNVEIKSLNNDKSETEDKIKETEMVVEQLTEELEKLTVVVQAEKDKLKTKTRVVKLIANSKENIGKLKELIETNENRKEELEKMWDVRRVPLQDEIESLEEELGKNKVDTESMLKEIQEIRRKMREAMVDTKNKDEVVQQLKSELESIDKQRKRSSYTRRIMEIVASIHKQKQGIVKILADNQNTQKLINQISGRIDRTFAIADEVFFKDAKKDDNVRQAYKYLVALHDGCNQLISTVQQTGSIVREIRELEQQIDKELTKNAEENLNKIIRDYKEMKKENQQLIKQIKQSRK